MIGRILERLIEPVFGVIDQAVTDKDQQEQLKAQIQLALSRRAGDLESYARDTIIAEMKGNWLQRSWRPIMMLWFAFIIGMFWFGFAPDYIVQNPSLTDKLFTVIQIGLGGFIVTEGGERMLERYSRTREREAEEATRQEQARNGPAS